MKIAELFNVKLTGVSTNEDYFLRAGEAYNFQCAFFIYFSYNLKFYCNLTAYNFVYISERTFHIGGNKFGRRANYPTIF